MVDTHAHLCDTSFDEDREVVIRRAKAVGITAIVSVSETLSDVQRNLELAAIHPSILPAAGLYPSHLDREQAQGVIDLVRERRQEFVALGEVGLDYWTVQEESEREIQQEIFLLFIDLAQELDLPLNIHSRSAGRQVIQLLLEKKARRVQLHAFDGRASKAMPAVEGGFFFSIPPSIVHSRQKQKLVQALPLANLLVETDSPVLGPVPDERNEPANVSVVIETIATIKGLSYDKVLTRVTKNTAELYQLAF